MATTVQQPTQNAAQAPPPTTKLWSGLPARIKVLYITTAQRESRWLTDAFGTDSAVEILLEEAIGATAGLARLRDEVFDAVLVSHEPGDLDALDVIEGLRAGGNEDPLIVIGHCVARDIEALCYEVGADAYCPLGDTTTRALLWKFAQAMGRRQLARENRRLAQAERQRLHQEHQEAERLLSQQRLLIGELETMSVSHSESRAVETNGQHSAPPRDAAEAATPPTPEGHPADDTQATATSCEAEPDSDKLPAGPVELDVPAQLPGPLVNHYRELLRAYVIMGAGNLTNEMSSLGNLLSDAGVSAQRTMQMHIHVLEELIGGLGSRSARHVMNRADLLILEVMVHLADGYRRRYRAERSPWRQLALPGFEACLTHRLDRSERCSAAH